MTTTNQQRVDEIFGQAIELPPDARAPFLANACGADCELRAEVETLLDHDARAAADFMQVPERPPLGPMRSGAEGDSGPLIGKRIGKYTICRVMAEGGMGIVYEAEQESPKRTVALKMMPLWEDSRSARRRFEYESQILAGLRHPNIAQVYEADVWKDDQTGSARPFFVMEFVPEAKSITRYVRECNLSLRERIELCLHVCEAVHHGHQRGVIHRDLKPGNILVDANGQVKIIDFGVAKATNSDVAMTTRRTEVGELVGTIQYMSPEQCADPLNLDIRTDVYSLGIVLYELLCDRLPYGVGNEAPNKGRKATRQRGNGWHEGTKGQDQYRDSDGVDKTVPDLGDVNEHVTGLAPVALIPNPLSMLRTICEVPPIRPSTIHRALRGDLEIILLKALEKDRQKRYQSAADLARDLRHYLAREPIEARGPSLAASAFLWTRRHPIFTTAIAAAAIGLTILATVMATVYVAHLRPYCIEFRDSNYEVALVSFNGNELHTWRSFGRDGIEPARIVSLPEENPARLLLLGFPQTHIGPLRGDLCAFDIDAREYKRPKWVSRIEPEDVPPVEPERRFRADDFSPEDLFGPYDIFPDQPGLEVVATFHHSYSRHAIRVISSNGEVLYQIWHDGTVSSAYWLSEANLLVFAGTNDEVPWIDRGLPDNKRHYSPWVVSAVRAVLGQRENRYVCTGRSTDCIAPAWYQCVMPFGLIDAIREVRVGPPPNAPLDDGEHFLLRMIYETTELLRQEREAGWVVDADGKKASESLLKNDAYLQNEKSRSIPRIEDFYLAPLPPILTRNRSEH